ncbi:uncharacterized protein A4U43_C06F20230 [Asparagus officinalis]|uniref:Uncharacterized protein n=2 Tax=Asparagus officinalis TaxID=4686 RepID=A0A5P1ENC4_ASPOF|nr:uncharacterized protein A4U43_C06F20230 [Asparagus officinalis]
MSKALTIFPSSTISGVAFLSRSYPSLPIPTSTITTAKPTKIQAKLGGGDGEAKRAEKKKFITKEQEPEQ